MVKLSHVTHFGLPGINRVPFGMHVCHPYANREELVAALVPYLVAGLRGKERCLWVTAPPLPASEAVHALRSAWSGVDDAIHGGALRILDFSQWYGNSAGLKERDMVQFWLKEEACALAEGYNGVRIAENTSFLRPGDWSMFLEYERVVTTHIKNRRILALCSYALAQCGDRDSREVMHAHDWALQRSDVHWHRVAPVQSRTAGAQAPYGGTDKMSERTLQASRTGSRTSLLVLDEDSAMVDALARTLQSSVPRLSIDTCTSSNEARQRLFTSPYHAIICSPTLTVAGGNSILTSSRRLDPPVPFLLRLKPDEFEFASQWLDLGVYDFLFSPFQLEQIRESIEDALLLSKWRALIARKQQALARLRERRDQYQCNTAETLLRHRVDELLTQSMLRIQESTASLEQTATRIEVSLKRLRQTCKNNELRAQQRAVNRLRTKVSDKCGDLFV